MKFLAAMVWAGLFLMQSVSWAQFDFEDGVSEGLRKAILSDMTFVEQLECSSETLPHHVIFGGYNGGVYSRWFNQRVTKFGVQEERGRNSSAAFISGHPSELFLTTDYLNESIPQLGRVAIYFHEARHAEGGVTPAYLHVLCPKIFKDQEGNDIVGRFSNIVVADKMGCDDTKFGAYGTQLMLMQNIFLFGTSKSVNGLLKKQARLYAKDYFQRIADTKGKSFSAREELQNDLGMVETGQ